MASDQHHFGPHKKGIEQVIACLIIGCCWGAVVGCNPSPLEPPTQPTTLVNTVRLRSDTDAMQTSSFLGWFAPAQQQLVHFQRGGQIQRVLVREKTFVRKGDVLARLQTRQLTEKRDRLQTAIEAQRAKTQDPSRPLGVDDRAKLAQLETELELVDLQFEQAELRAPFSGSVWKLMVQDGQAVSPQTPVLDLFDYSSAVVVTNLPDSVASRLGQDSEAVIQIGSESFPARRRKLPGEPEVVDPTIVCFEFLEPPSPLLCRLEGIATVHLKLPTEPGGFWIPVSALVRDADDRWSVMTTTKSPGQTTHQIQKRTLQQIEFDHARVFVTGDLREGERLVVDGVHRVVDGQVVEPIEHNRWEWTDQLPIDSIGDPGNSMVPGNSTGADPAETSIEGGPQ